MFILPNIYFAELYSNAGAKKSVEEAKQSGRSSISVRRGPIYFSVCSTAINCHLTKTSRTQLK